MRKAGLNPMIASAALVVACMVSGPTAHAYAAPVPEAAASEAPQTKAGIITGKVMDEEGEPLPGASIKWGVYTYCDICRNEGCRNQGSV